MNEKLKESIVQEFVKSEGVDIDPARLLKVLYAELDVIGQAMIEAMLPKWKAAPQGSLCLSCGKESLERSHYLMGGPFSGTVRCTACEYRDTVVGYLSRTIVKVEPMPEGAKPPSPDEKPEDG